MLVSVGSAIVNGNECAREEGQIDLGFTVYFVALCGGTQG